MLIIKPLLKIIKCLTGAYLLVILSACYNSKKTIGGRDGMPNSRIEARPTSGAVEAEILGIDLSGDLDDAAADVERAHVA